MMTQECSVLGNDGSYRFARAFLDRYLPLRAAFSEDYPVPESADHPTVVLGTEHEILAYLEPVP